MPDFRQVARELIADNTSAEAIVSRRAVLCYVLIFGTVIALALLYLEFGS